MKTKETIALFGTLLVSALVVGGQVVAQKKLPEKLPEFLTEMTATAQPAAKVKPGTAGKITLKVKVAPEFHLYGPKSADGIPTEVKVTPVAGVTFGTVQYPGKPTDVYRGETVFTVPFTVAKTAKKGGKLTLLGTLRTQACTETSCLRPMNLPFKVTVEVGN
jgi:DsbC/DsbD-like thiol-disulfide interchange protein